MGGPKLLFVYGSLRTESPHPFAVKLRSQGRLLGKGTAPGILYDLGRYPAALFGAEHDTRVIGEIFELPRDGRLLRELDYFEGTEEPASPLSRIEIEVLFDDGSPFRLETYSLGAPPPIKRVIASGDWIAHSLNRSRILR
jgi:gamma-glutamylcyclotransferase (GGCT)/AIG2-like uncharacterized protein YtfP